MPTPDLMPQLEINSELTRDVLLSFIKDQTTSAGFNRVVVGLSGGIDSALVAYLAVASLGVENVLGVRMPYQSSSQESLDHAQLVIDALGIEALTVEITDMVEPLFTRFPGMSNLRRGNIMARQRMVVLFDQSAAFSGLVLGTGNKTEMLLGYSTLYGDSAAALHPIADLYKCQVRQLSRFMDVPGVIVDKPPSADLWPGQTDEKELGYTYDEADQVLYLLVDQRYSPEEVIAEGFEESFVCKIYDTVRKMHYKRTMPIIPKLSQRTIGFDFLYLRDWGSRH